MAGYIPLNIQAFSCDTAGSRTLSESGNFYGVKQYVLMRHVQVTMNDIIIAVYEKKALDESLQTNGENDETRFHTLILVDSITLVVNYVLTAANPLLNYL